jgi:Asp-tRNA(Asn)/Glu-tRNA(Gln) amidotransferase C subunit
MNNNYDEIKKLLKASRVMLSNETMNESISQIKNIYGIIEEQKIDLSSGNITKKLNPAKSVEDFMDKEENQDKKNEKSQGYRVSGGIIVLHGDKESDVELTTDEKTAFQSTMDEFVNEVSEMVDFNKLNVYKDNVEWSGRIIDFDVEFFFSIGEKNGIYINGDMVKADQDFLEKIQKLNAFYEKFKSKWGKVLASRKLTKKEQK